MSSIKLWHCSSSLSHFYTCASNLDRSLQLLLHVHSCISSTFIQSPPQLGLSIVCTVCSWVFFHSSSFSIICWYSYSSFLFTCPNQLNLLLSIWFCIFLHLGISPNLRVPASLSPGFPITPFRNFISTALCSIFLKYIHVYSKFTFFVYIFIQQ